MKGIKTIYDVGSHEKVIKTIYVIRNTVTTFISIAVAIGITAQGEVRTGQRIVDAILLYIFMKWMSLDTWDYIRYLVTGRRRENERSNHGI